MNVANIYLRALFAGVLWYPLTALGNDVTSQAPLLECFPYGGKKICLTLADHPVSIHIDDNPFGDEVFFDEPLKDINLKTQIEASLLESFQDGFEASPLKIPGEKQPVSIFVRKIDIQNVLDESWEKTVNVGSKLVKRQIKIQGDYFKYHLIFHFEMKTADGLSHPYIKSLGPLYLHHRMTVKKLFKSTFDAGSALKPLATLAGTPTFIIDAINNLIGGQIEIDKESEVVKHFYLFDSMRESKLANGESGGSPSSFKTKLFRDVVFPTGAWATETIVPGSASCKKSPRYDINEGAMLVAQAIVQGKCIRQVSIDGINWKFYGSKTKPINLPGEGKFLHTIGKFKAENSDVVMTYEYVIQEKNGKLLVVNDLISVNGQNNWLGMKPAYRIQVNEELQTSIRLLITKLKYSLQNLVNEPCVQKGFLSFI